MNQSDENVVGRLKTYRVWLAFSLIFIVGAACTVVNFGAERHWFELSGPLALIPWLAIGEAFLSAVVIGLIYERFVRRESEKDLSRILSIALNRQTESTVAKVVSAAALTLDSLRRLSHDELDAAFRRVLTVRLNDEALADEVVGGIVPQAIGTVDRFVDLRHRIQLLPDGDLPEHPLRYMTVRVTVSSRRVLKRDVLRFGICEEMTPVYAKLNDSVQWDVLWSPGRLHYYNVNDPRTFCVEYVQINDMMLNITRLPDSHFAEVSTPMVGYEASKLGLIDLVGQEVEVEYCYTTKVGKTGHVLAFPITQASRGVNFEFLIGNVGISWATLWPFFVTANPPQILRHTAGEYNVLVARTSRWVLAGGGIALVWKLEPEERDGFLS